MSRVLAGPFCCMMLADHGADVVKVEPPEGDETRRYGPPFVDGESTYYMGLNRNKRSIALDLSRAESQEVIRRLVMSSDVLVENFRTGTMERWGLDYAALSALNPRLLYLSISGFGRSGPYKDVAGYDGALQAFGGFMSINGDVDGEPLKAGIAIADFTTGLFASSGDSAGAARPPVDRCGPASRGLAAGVAAVDPAPALEQLPERRAWWASRMATATR